MGKVTAQKYIVGMSLEALVGKFSFTSHHVAQVKIHRESKLGGASVANPGAIPSDSERHMLLISGGTEWIMTES